MEKVFRVVVKTHGEVTNYGVQCLECRGKRILSITRDKIGISEFPEALHIMLSLHQCKNETDWPVEE